MNESDIVRRNIKRELPCKLNDDEFTRIAKTRALREQEREELMQDFAKEKKRRNDQIEEIDDEIKIQGKELRTGYQDRTVNCHEVFVRDSENTGWIFTMRLDTGVEVERRPASAYETQRYLPAMNPADAQQHDDTPVDESVVEILRDDAGDENIVDSKTKTKKAKAKKS